ATSAVCSCGAATACASGSAAPMVSAGCASRAVMIGPWWWSAWSNSFFIANPLLLRRRHVPALSTLSEYNQDFPAADVSRLEDGSSNLCLPIPATQLWASGTPFGLNGDNARARAFWVDDHVSLIPPGRLWRDCRLMDTRESRAFTASYARAVRRV